MDSVKPTSVPRTIGFAEAHDLIERLTELLQQEFTDQLLAVAVFGSVARGSARATSDLDLLIVLRARDPDATTRFVRVLPPLRSSVGYQRLHQQGVQLDPAPVFFDEEQLKEHPWLLLDIVDHGRIVWDPAGVLAREVQAVQEALRRYGAKRIVLPGGTWFWDLKPDWRPGEVISL